MTAWNTIMNISHTELERLTKTAIEAAQLGGSILNDYAQKGFEIQKKSEINLVTEADLAAEKAIVNVISQSFPSHQILAEEKGLHTTHESPYKWIIDPLDGTTNFIKGIPHFSVSIALKVKGKLDQAVIYDPIRGELFSASRGKGAQLNGFRIRVNKAKELNSAVLATGFPFKQKQHTSAYMNMFQSLFLKTTDMRRAGSAALDLAYVAAGRVDGFFEIGLKPWDTAAGELLVIESGGLVTDFVGGHNHEKSGNIVAGSSLILKDILKDIRPHLGDALSK